ncbi:MAG: efflux RND transporter periplasmic adaptor subunit [Acidobacteriia bacterium]|nr:efflux RND transporter periplasmic adaptor subunit [Terriglobia bacterium]
MTLPFEEHAQNGASARLRTPVAVHLVGPRRALCAFEELAQNGAARREPKSRVPSGFGGAASALGAVLILILLLFGCSSPARDPSPPVAKQAREPSSAIQITLDAAAQRQAGIVVAEASASQLSDLIRMTGRLALHGTRNWRVGAITDGRVVKLYTSVGDRVEAGQVLARIHSHEVHEGRAEYQKAASELSRLRASETYSRGLRDRARRLLDLKAGSVEQVERAESELRNAQGAVAQAQTELERTRTHLLDFLGVKLEDPSDHKSGEHDGDDDLIPVRSPAAGVVQEQKVTAGSVVSPASEMFVVADPSVLWMIGALGEEHLSKIRKGMAVQVGVQAYPGRSFPGRVERLGEQLDPATRTIQVLVELNNRGGLLKPEMFAEATIPGTAGRSAILIPQTSLQEIKGQQTVFVQTGANEFEVRAVDVRSSTEGPMGGMTEVLGGLKRGDRVVTQGAFILKSQLLRTSLAEE